MHTTFHLLCNYSSTVVAVHTCDFSFILLDASYMFTAASSHVGLENIEVDDLNKVSLHVNIHLHYGSHH